MRNGWGALVLLATGLAGCATFGTYQTARPIERGSVQVGVEPGMWHLRDGGAAPVGNLTARYGFGTTWDLGVRAGTAGIGATGKFALHGATSGRLAVSLAPSASMLPWGDKGVHVQVPLLVGLALGPHEIGVAPSLQAWSVLRPGTSEARRATSILAGVSVGGSVRIARGVRLLPQVTFARPIAGAVQTRAVFENVELRPGRPLYQASLGVLLGGEVGWWRTGPAGWGVGGWGRYR